MHKTTPIVAANPIPIVSIKGTMAALPDAAKIYCIKYFDAITAVRCSGIASAENQSVEFSRK
jgi:hypothetical protein